VLYGVIMVIGVRLALQLGKGDLAPAEV